MIVLPLHDGICHYKNGYKYICMWECEFDRQCKESRQLQNYIEPLEIVTPLEPRDPFYGGRTEVFTLYKEAGHIHMYLYPFSSRYFLLSIVL
jgi:hypothetical protein